MKKILIVEDNQDILETTAEILELKGYKIETAINGRKGFELAKTKQPDLIISDIRMPEMNGFEMLAALRADNITIPCILLSANAQKKDILKGEYSKADHYLTKPFTIVDLEDAVKKVLSYP